MIVRYCSCFFVVFYYSFPPLGTTWVEAAEGESAVTRPAIRWINASTVKVQVVCVGR